MSENLFTLMIILLYDDLVIRHLRCTLMLNKYEVIVNYIYIADSVNWYSNGLL